MHYGGGKTDCLKFHNTPYMTLNSNGQTIPENKELSTQDIQTLKRFYAPPANVKCYDGIHLQSRCITKNALGKWRPEHHQNVQSGNYLPFSIFNNRTSYQKIEPDLNENKWFLFKNDDLNAWTLWRHHNESLFGARNLDMSESVTG